MLAAAATALGSLAAVPAQAATHSGSVSVLSAGSLQTLMQDQIGPAFQKATGYTLDNVSMGSKALASSITGGTLQGDVFISASPAVNASLEGGANGNWVSWYDQFASSPLVLGYNPSSKFAAALKTKPWYKVIAEPGFLIGRTDPTTDPKGVLSVSALDRAAAKHHLPQLKALASQTGDVFPETSLVGELQAGQLDAGFFYVVEAKTAHVPTVPLTPIYKYADYTVTLLNNAENQSGGEALVSFLLSPKRKAVEKEYGLVPIKPKFSGDASAVPASLRSIVGAG